MEELGEFLGWVTGACFAAAILDFLLKRVNKYWVSALPKDAPIRHPFQQVMKFAVKNHRYFGIAAAAVAGVHLLVQVTWEFPSATGLVAASLLILTALLGIVMLYGRKGKLIGIHRVVAAAGVLALLVHLVAKA